MSITSEQYLALSAVCYTNFDASIIEELSKSGVTINYLIGSGKIPDYKDDSTNIINSKYQHLASLGGWKLINFQPNTTSDFAAAAFQNHDTKEIVFAFRGTEPNKSA